MRSPAQHLKARYETSLLIYFLSSLCHLHKIAAVPRDGSGGREAAGRAVSPRKRRLGRLKCSRSTSCFELAWAKDAAAHRSGAAPVPRDGHIDLGKLDAYDSSMTFAVVGTVLFLLPRWQTRTVNIFNGWELVLLARWDGCERWVGPASLLSRRVP